MAMKKEIPNEHLEPLIFVIRGYRVLLDTDLARLYGVSTFRFNEAFKRSGHRFPQDFAFQLTVAEFNGIRSQFATSSRQETDSAGKNQISSQSAMRYRRRRAWRTDPGPSPSTAR